MLAGIGIGLATQMAFSLWRSHRHSLQLARYDDHYVLRIQQNLTFMHNPHLLALLAKIPEKSVVIVEHDSVGYLDPDVRAVLDDFAENARSAASALIIGRWPAADLNGRLVRSLRDPPIAKRRGIPCSTLSGLSRQPQGNEHDHH